MVPCSPSPCERLSRIRFTAFPVCSGFPDYYGSCVTMPGTAGFRSSPFSHNEISVACCRMGLSPFGSILSLRSPVCHTRTVNQAVRSRSPAFQSLSQVGGTGPSLWLSYQAIQLSSSCTPFHPHASLPTDTPVSQRLPFWQRHATLPGEFPHPDKP